MEELLISCDSCDLEMERWTRTSCVGFACSLREGRGEAEAYGMPLVLFFRNYRYRQIFEDISNSFTDICNSITDSCKRIADIRN